MIIGQRNIVYILLIVLGIYLCSYTFILYSKAIDISNLTRIKYFAITVFSIAFVASLILMKKEKNIWLTIYETVGLMLILFFILSIFIFKIEDIYFWDVNKMKHKDFFKFSFDLLGYNYLFSLPYVVLLICEFTFLFRRYNIRSNS